MTPATPRPAHTPRPRLLLVISLGALLALLAFAAAACGDDTDSEASPTDSVEAGSTGGSLEEGAVGPEGVGTVVTTPNGDSYIDISADELATMLEDKDFLLINTHIPYEGDIPQTDLFIPFDQAADQVDQLPDDKAAKIVVYCRSDNMSRQAIDVWAAEGYTNLYNLDGGFVAWQDAGYEMVQNDWEQ